MIGISYDHLMMLARNWALVRFLESLEILIQVALVLDQEDPTKYTEQWMSEPVKCIVVPSSLFVANQKKYPVLSKSVQAFLRTYLDMDCKVIIQNSPSCDLSQFAGGVGAMIDYLQFLVRSCNQSKNHVDKFTEGYLECVFSLFYRTANQVAGYKPHFNH